MFLSTVTISGLLLLILLLYNLLPSPTSPLSHLPIFGIFPGPFGWLKTTYNALFHLEATIERGYLACNARNQPFRVPWPGRGYVVVLPSAWIAQIKNLYERDLSSVEGACQLIDIGNNMLADFMNIRVYDYFNLVVKNTLKRDLKDHQAALEKEVAGAFEEWIPKLEAQRDGERWFEYSSEMSLSVIIRSSSLFVAGGAAFGRNKEFCRLMMEFGVTLGTIGTLMTTFPDWLRSIVRPILNFRQHYRMKKMVEIMRPDIEARMKQHQENVKAKAEGRLHDIVPLPDDTMSGVITGADADNPATLDVSIIAGQMRVICFAAMHSTSITMLHCISNIASLRHISTSGTSTTSSSYADLLRSEILQKHADFHLPPTAPETGLHPATLGWTHEALENLDGLDSFIKETLRLDMTLGVTMHRNVANPAGITLKSGLFLPHNTFVCFPGLSVSHHETVPNGSTFSGFRYGGSGFEGGARATGAATTSETYLAFAVGRHACPGRFLAVKLLKLMLVYLLLNFEIKELDQKGPGGHWFMFNIPSMLMGQKIWIRRRKFGEEKEEVEKK